MSSHAEVHCSHVASETIVPAHRLVYHSGQAEWHTAKQSDRSVESENTHRQHNIDSKTFCSGKPVQSVCFVLLYFRLFTFSDLYWVCLYFPVLFCLSLSVKWLAVKTASEMTSIVSGGVVNSTQTKPNQSLCKIFLTFRHLSFLSTTCRAGFSKQVKVHVKCYVISYLNLQ